MLGSNPEPDTMESRQSPLLTLAFVSGLVAFGLLLVAGFYRSAHVDGRFPPLMPSYGLWINALASEGDWEQVLRQLRLSAALDLENPGVAVEVVPNLVRVARRLDDRESELFAWRRLVALRPTQAAAHSELASALLAIPEPSDDERREAQRHSLRALELAPGSARARIDLARLALLAGREEDASLLLREAEGIDPARTHRSLARLESRYPGFVAAFRSGRAAGGGS